MIFISSIYYIYIKDPLQNLDVENDTSTSSFGVSEEVRFKIQIVSSIKDISVPAGQDTLPGAILRFKLPGFAGAASKNIKKQHILTAITSQCKSVKIWDDKIQFCKHATILGTQSHINLRFPTYWMLPAITGDLLKSCHLLRNIVSIL